jgi:hypothetical protein
VRARQDEIDQARLRATLVELADPFLARELLTRLSLVLRSGAEGEEGEQAVGEESHGHNHRLRRGTKSVHP